MMFILSFCVCCFSLHSSMEAKLQEQRMDQKPGDMLKLGPVSPIFSISTFLLLFYEINFSF